MSGQCQFVLALGRGTVRGAIESPDGQCPVCGGRFNPKGLPAHMGRKHRTKPTRLEEAERLLQMAHDSHGFTGEHCTPENCSVEAYLTLHGIGWRFRGWDKEPEERAALRARGAAR